MQIEKNSREEDLNALSSVIEENKKNLNYLSCFVKEAFLSALNFKYIFYLHFIFILKRYHEIVNYFLENGLNLNDENFKDSLLTVCRISKFTLNDPPIELLDLLIFYGADTNYCDQDKFK